MNTTLRQRTDCGWHGPYPQTVGGPICSRCGYPAPPEQLQVAGRRVIELGTGR